MEKIGFGSAKMVPEPVGMPGKMHIFFFTHRKMHSRYLFQTNITEKLIYNKVQCLWGNYLRETIATIQPHLKLPQRKAPMVDMTQKMHHMDKPLVRVTPDVPRE